VAESYDRIWEQFIERQGRQHGTRAMVELIRMGREFGYAKLTTAVDQALEMGCADVAEIRHLLMSDQLRHSVGEAVEIGSLSAYERPLPTMIEYDQLFSGSVQASLQTASIAQHARRCAWPPSVPSSPHLPKKSCNATTRICTTSKPCCRPR
jgi:hypothetical protein